LGLILGAEWLCIFKQATSFNQDISKWNVTNMYGMFYKTTAFNQNISNWDVSNVTSHTDFSKDSNIIAEPNW